MKVTETARVLSVRDDRAEVAMAVDDDAGKCSACAMESHCRSRERRFTVEAPETVKAGDEVVVEIDAPSPAMAAFLVFMLPLVMAFLAGGIAYGFTRSETLGLLGGLAGAAAVYLAIRFSRLGTEGVGRIVGVGGRLGPCGQGVDGAGRDGTEGAQ